MFMYTEILFISGCLMEYEKKEGQRGVGEKRKRNAKVKKKEKRCKIHVYMLYMPCLCSQVIIWV